MHFGNLKKNTYNGNFYGEAIKVFTSGKNEMKLILEEGMMRVNVYWKKKYSNLNLEEHQEAQGSASIIQQPIKILMNAKPLLYCNEM